MADLHDPGPRKLLEEPNHAVVSTIDKDGTIHSAVVWAGVENGTLTLNSAKGRRWPANVERDPRVTVTVYEESNPFHYVEVRGTAEPTTEGADEHIDRLAKVYLGKDTYPFRQPGEQRIKIRVKPEKVRYVSPN